MKARLVQLHFRSNNGPEVVHQTKRVREVLGDGSGILRPGPLESVSAAVEAAEPPRVDGDVYPRSDGFSACDRGRVEAGPVTGIAGDYLCNPDMPPVSIIDEKGRRERPTGGRAPWLRLVSRYSDAAN